MASDFKQWDVFRYPKWLLDNLLEKYNVIYIYPAGFASSNVGSGGGGGYPFYCEVRTGTTANSRGMLYTVCFGLRRDSAYAIDWTKDIHIFFTIMRYGSDPEAVARVQLKLTNTEGALANLGVGIEIDNLTLYGEGYGTARGTVLLGTLTEYTVYKIRISKVGSILQFYIDGVLSGTLSGSYVPNALASTTYPVISIVNGPTGGVNATLDVGHFIIVQKR